MIAWDFLLIIANLHNYMRDERIFKLMDTNTRHDNKSIAIYNQALDDFYNGLATELLWIKEKYGVNAYTEAWCDIGCLREALKKQM